MADEPQIPFGFRRVFGQLQKGDGVWDGVSFKRTKRKPHELIIRRTKMLYPCTDVDTFAIRPCAVEQTEIVKDDPLSFD